MDKIRFGVTVEAIKRDEPRKLWLVKISGEDTTRPFDKIIYAVGTETKAKLPTIEGQEQFQGRLIHGQAYKRYESRVIYARDLTNVVIKRPEEFAGMNVIVLGQGNSAADCAVVGLTTPKELPCMRHANAVPGAYRKSIQGILRPSTRSLGHPAYGERQEVRPICHVEGRVYIILG